MLGRIEATATLEEAIGTAQGYVAGPWYADNGRTRSAQDGLSPWQLEESDYLALPALEADLSGNAVFEFRNPRRLMVAGAVVFRPIR